MGTSVIRARRVRWVPARARQLSQRPEAVLAVLAIGLELYMRYRMRSYETGDYHVYLKPWAEYIRSHGFHAYGDNFSDYNVPYLYVLGLMAQLPDYLPIGLLTAIRLGSVIFDGVLAFFAYRIVALRYANWRVPLLAAIVVFGLPTVTMNGALWGQCDSIYTAFGLAGLYYFLRDRPWLGCAAFGIAYAFKQQALFLFPLLLVLLLTRKVPWRTCLAIPAVFLALDLPAWLAGRPLGDLLNIYTAQQNAEGVMVLNAPSVWALVPTPAPEDTRMFIQVGMVLTVVVFLVLAYVIVSARARLTDERLVLLATTSAIVAPFLLPGMHERYFYVADVLTVLAAFYLPRRLWYLPLLIQLASFMAYTRFLFGQRPVLDFPILSLIVMTAAVSVTFVLLNGVVRDPGRNAAEVSDAGPADATPASEPELIASMPR
jgi:Gpi18-like mannosyltransferase